MKISGGSFILFIALLWFNSVQAQHKFTLNLNDISDDLFRVTLVPDGLTEENDIFQFAATAPGTYQIMDIGRFVHDFTAFDANGDTLPSARTSTNQWKLTHPEKIKKIIYSIAETWDTPVKSHKVYDMAGTSLEKDNAFINNQGVVGYFKGMQSHELWIKLQYPSGWKIGTALTQNAEGYYTAPTYDFAVDSPFMLGRLTGASADIEGTKVDIYTYSKTDLIKSEDLLSGMKDILYAASDFTEGLPVKRYVFLFHFEDLDYGAWEHSYSSIYALKETPLNDDRVEAIRSMAAHEFFHVVTPLNIHSELVEKFNFEKPVLSQHLWLYEGVTEWAAGLMQVRDSVITLEEYLDELTKKLRVNDAYDQNLSLTELGVRATELPAQYGNIYYKGAMTACLLDLLILDQSKGKRALREVIIELSKKYGPNKPFDEKTFFDELVDMTYPEVRDFIERYIKGTESLPVKEYFDKVGIAYSQFAGYDSTNVSLGLGFTVKDENVVVSAVNDPDSKIQVNDMVEAINGTQISLQNAGAEFSKLHQLNVGDTVSFTFQRDGDEVHIDCPLSAQKISHKFEVMDNPTKKQLKLRRRWLTNS